MPSNQLTRTKNPEFCKRCGDEPSYSVVIPCNSVNPSYTYLLYTSLYEALYIYPSPWRCNQVRTMHALDHKNVLKFHAWYETTNHLWLILEYCVGGDLLSLLRQDVRLPESSVHDFARDLTVSLQVWRGKV